MPKKKNLLKNVSILFVFLLVVWGLYRVLFKLPEQVEELVIKPIVWLVPTFYFVFVKEKDKLESVGITFKNLFPAVYFSIALGALFGVVAMVLNFIKYKGMFNFEANLGNLPLLSSVGISLITATSEEIAFRGYILSRLWKSMGSELMANIVTSVLWVAIHIPVTVFVLKLNFSAAFVYLMLTFVYSLGAGFVYARTKNVFSSIFLHVLWEWPIILFR